MRWILGLAILASACTSGPIVTTVTDPFPVEVPAGEACSDVIEVPIAEDTAHVESLAQIDNVRTDPPTSGKHFGAWITEPGVSTSPQHDGRTIHNLEHGYVIVHYRDISDEQLAVIRAPVEADPRMTLLVPRPTMPWVLAMTSWGRIQVCSEVPPDASALVIAFMTENRDNAPESIL